MTRRPDRETWLFAALIVLHLLPVWLLPFAPTQDGPAHLSMAHALRQDGTSEGNYLREYFVPNEEAVPNRFIFFLLADVLRFLSLPVAEKVLLSAYVVLLPLSARYALRSVRPQAGFLAFLSFPFTYNFLLNMGFYNFCFSLPAFLFSLGFWLRQRGRLGIARTAGLALLILWTYFCHPVTLGVLVGTLLTLASWRTLLALRRRQGLRSLRWLAGPLMASAPAVVLLLSFFQDRMGGPVSDMTLAAKARQLAALYSLVSLDTRLVAFSLALSTVLGLLALTALGHRSRRRHLLRADGLLLATLLLTVIYFVAPNEMGQGGFVTHRLNLFPFLVLILWLGTFSFPEALRVSIRSAGAAISFGFLGAMFAIWAGLGAYLSDILTAAPHVEPRRTLLTLSFSNAGVEEDGSGDLTFRTWPFVHAGSHIAARVSVVDLALYEAHEDYFPLTYRPERDPFVHLVREPLELEAEPPRVDLPGYRARTGGRIDYVLLVWPEALPPDDPRARELRRQLAATYERIHTSPEGLAELWRWRWP
ncbi:MAG TPA: hypothetical protein VN493_17100 [Thermoanaerobaculia bacterium]|nr:hypothetical protein [Thermoanaerobaculia bacterium]